MHRYKLDKAGKISSWKKLELEGRSTPAAVSVQNPLLISEAFKDPNGRHKYGPEDDSVTSWAKTFHSLAQSTISLSSSSKNSSGGLQRKTVDMESHPRSPLRIPVLTVTLIKLHDVFEIFCHHITDTTSSSAQAACFVLDSAEIASSPKITEPNSPARIIVSPGSHESSSPSRSPLTSWFTGSNISESEYSQKSEWEKVCNPLIMFAGLEAVYSACSHVESHIQALALVRLYKRTTEDLRAIRKDLCDPFVYSTRSEVSPELDTISLYKRKAITLSLSIEAIMV